MIQKGKTNSWPEHAEEMIERSFQYTNFVIYIGQSIRAQCQIDKEKLKSIDLVLIYDEIDDVFVAWNTVIHQELHAGEKVTLSVGKSKLKKAKSGNIEFLKHLLSGTKGQSGRKENVAMIPPERLFDFLQSFDVYCEKFADDNSTSYSLKEFQRKVDGVFRKRRDPKFRERILEKYSSTCVICGETDEVVLEAAHIIAVGHGGDDSVDNGICLCANHHRMYDAALLDIDLAKGIFYSKRDKLTQRLVYSSTDILI